MNCPFRPDPPAGQNRASRSVFLVVSPQAIVAEFLQTFVDYPPRMKAASFPIDQVQGKLESAIACGR